MMLKRTDMEKKLVQLFETVKTAADAAAAPGGGPADESRCIDSLRVLKTFPVNFDILVETKVGRRLRNLKKHPRKKIQASVTDLIRVWKNIITEEANQNNKKKNKLDSGVKVEKSKVKQARPAKKVKSDTSDVLTEEEKQSSDVRSPSKGLPNMLLNLIKCNDGARYNLRKLLLEGLCKVDSEADESIRDKVKACYSPGIAIAVESALFDKWGSCTGPYRARYRSVVFNIKDNNNNDFRRKVLLGDIKAESIPSMTTEEMASDNRKLENEFIKIKALFDCQHGGKQEATTNEFRCGHCGQRECTYFQLQTRSADEPMTTYVTCQNCDKCWKFC